MINLPFLRPLVKFIALWSVLFMPTNGRFAGELAEPLSVHRLARLPNDVVPIWYNLTMVTYVPGYIKFAEEKNQTFTGHLTIKVHALHSTNKIELHAKDLTVPSTGTEVFVDSTEQAAHSQNSSQGGAIKVSSVDVDNNLERVVIKLSSSLIEGNDYYIKFHYNGKILDDEQGFYYSSYIAKSDGKERFLASTHMEPNSARYMVPCFDEPHLKAVWRLTVVHPKGTNAIFNAIETGLKQRDEDWTETTFDETPVMSSYLLAIVVSDYSYHESYVKSFNGQNIRFRVYANENGLHQINLALEAGVKALTFYEKHFGISFPIPKMDMISVPRFSAGAMENWGLVTFRESAMLYTEASGVSAKHWVAEVISHELTHQWFGDLVTLNWWDDLFLNEGFATLFSSLGAVQSVKDYDIEGSFLYNMQNAFAYDSDKDAPPLSPHSGFDGIAYDKGASILRMIEMVMGPENFIHGIRRYLNKHQFSNTKHSHLLEALHAGIPPSENNILASPPKGSPLSIVDFGKAWIETPGHPLVSVTRLDSSRRINMANSIWYSVNNVTQKLTWLHDVLVLENIKESDLLTINEKSHGYYRVKYRGDLMQKIRQRLLTKHSDFSPLARARIIDDAFALANADRLNYDSALNLVFYEEDHKIPKALVHKHLISILDHFDESDDPKTAQYIRQLSKGFSEGNDRAFVFRAPPYRGKSDMSFDQWKLEKRLTEEHERELQKDSPSKDVIISEFKNIC